MEIIKFNTNFDFKRLTLANPEPLQSSTYFTKISLESDKPFCIQMPKCQTKQGLVDIKGVKYCDLMYERSVNEDLMNWLERLEYACQDKLCEKKELWFQTELSRDDIESMMSPIMRVYQSGKYILIRISLNAQKINGLEKSIAYNEQEANIDLDKLEATDSIVPLIIIHGIKFSSRSFEIDIRLSQMMIFDKPTESPCLIKYVGKKEPVVAAAEALVIKTPVQVVSDVKADAKADANANVKVNEKVNEKDKAKIVLNEKVNVKEKANDNIITIAPIINPSPSLEEISIDYEHISDTISLKNPNEVYYEIYKAAREKAKQLRKVAMEAYLEAKEIKTKYMLSDVEDSDEDSDEDSEDLSDNDDIDIEDT